MGLAAAVMARSVYASSKEDFAAFLRLAGGSVADPASFAIPVDVDEDADSYTLVFEVGGRHQAEIDVQATERSLVVWGSAWRSRREMRFCLFPEPVDPKSLELTASGDSLAIHIRKGLRGAPKPR